MCVFHILATLKLVFLGMKKQREGEFPPSASIRRYTCFLPGTVLFSGSSLIFIRGLPLTSTSWITQAHQADISGGEQKRVWMSEHASGVTL